FHERSLHADLGLALALTAQRLVRPELRILVMSATLDVAPVARLLGDVPVIVSEGREFPVDTRYLREPLADRRDARLIEARVAATSVTIEGVHVVIDSGLARVPRFSPRTGMTRLETVQVNAASADQRRGRAGRLAPGICYRLWTEAEQIQLVPRGSPEILEADLAPLALELAV